ncbi:MAG: NADH:ubiquinone reductase (Na(+)-transporting) subunit C, partial [Saprospiraceae bacterium]
VLGMTVVVALVLAGMYTVLKPIHDINEAVFNKRAAISAVKDVSNLSDEELLQLFDEKVTQFVFGADGKEAENNEILAEKIDLAKELKKDEKNRKYPVYIYKDGGETFYICQVRGKGLWDAIWAYVAVKSDENTIAGVSFDHKGETPGLGAEIKDNPSFPKSFKGEKLINAEGEYESVKVQKGGADPIDPHAVDAISGATITGDGVTKMMQSGMKPYLAYFKNN